MKKNMLFTFIVSGVAFAASAVSAQTTLNLTVKPERETVLDAAGGCILQVQVEAKPSTDKHRSPLNLALVLDRSGSMRGAKLEKAKQAACIAVEQLGPYDTFSLVVYDDESQVLIPAAKVTEPEALKAKINGIVEGGGTGLYSGVEKGAEQLNRFLDSERINRVVLLSDGMANVGPSTPSDLAKLGARLNKRGITTSTIGLGDDYNEDLMTALAEAGHANYYYVRDAEKLPSIFRDELGEVKSVVARKVRLRITMPDGVVMTRVLGESGITAQGSALEIPLENFFGKQKRVFLLECRLPAGTQVQQVAKVSLEYVNADGSEEKQAASCSVQRSAETAAVEKSLVSEVASSVAITRNRLAKDEAVKLADEGRANEASSLLRQQAVINAALPAGAQSPRLASETQALKDRAVELEAGGISKSTRKEMLYENYQDKNSKR